MYSNYIKRIFDIIVCIIVLPFFLLLLIVLGFLIKIEDGGSIFYSSERIGKDGKMFMMLKFRSMKTDAPNILNPDGSTFNSKEDKRVTKVGKIIRMTSIDEIPQIINVIKGDMSIIGPRPSLSIAIDTYKEDELDKMKVKPGITGFSQAYYRNKLSVRDKRLIDAWYANNVTFWLDIKILFKTVEIVLKREGLYTNDVLSSESGNVDS